MGTGRRGEDGTLVQILVEPELKLVSVPVTTHVRITVAPTVLGAEATPRPVMYPVLVSDRTVINCLLQNQFDTPPPPALQAMELRITNSSTRLSKEAGRSANLSNSSS